MDVSSSTSRRVDYDRLNLDTHEANETHDEQPRATTTTSEAAPEPHMSEAHCATLWRGGTAVVGALVGANVGVMMGPSGPGKVGLALSGFAAGAAIGTSIGDMLGVAMCAPDAPHGSTPATAAPSPKAPAPAPSATQSHSPAPAPAPAPAAPPADSCSEDPNQIPCATAGAVVIQG